MKIALDYILAELEKAEAKHPEFPALPSDGLSIICEETGELAQAINDGEGTERLAEEAAHVAVTAIRFIRGLRK